MLPARDPALFAAGALPVADPGKAPSAEDFSEALAKKLGRKGGDACGRFRKWLCSSSTCRGNGSGSGGGSGGGGGDQWNLPLTEEERVAFQAAYGEWSERRDRYEAWRASVQAAEVRLLLLLSTKTNTTTTTTTTINRDNAGGATTRRAWLFWAPSVAAGVLATVPMVSGATVALFLPAFFLLLLVRTATVETEDKKFVKRQDKIVSETKAQHRCGSAASSAAPAHARLLRRPPVCLVGRSFPACPGRSVRRFSPCTSARAPLAAARHRAGHPELAAESRQGPQRGKEKEGRGKKRRRRRRRRRVSNSSKTRKRVRLRFKSRPTRHRRLRRRVL